MKRDGSIRSRHWSAHRVDTFRRAECAWRGFLSCRSRLGWSAIPILFLVSLPLQQGLPSLQAASTARAEALAGTRPIPIARRLVVEVQKGLALLTSLSLGGCNPFLSLRNVHRVPHPWVGKFELESRICSCTRRPREVGPTCRKGPGAYLLGKDPRLCPAFPLMGQTSAD